jgi:hypothetical protein
MTEPTETVGLQPVVTWPRHVEVGGQYVVLADLILSDPDSWPYTREEMVIGCVLEGGAAFSVEALGGTSLVLHRFGGTYGSVRFLVRVNREPSPSESLRLTYLTEGGWPFRMMRLDTAADPAGGREPTKTITVERYPKSNRARRSERPSSPPPDSVPTRLPSMDGTGDDVWSMAAFDIDGKPVIALGTDSGTARIWWPATGVVDTYEVAPGRVHVTSLLGPDGRVRLLAGAGRVMVLLDPADGTVQSRQFIPGAETVTSLTALAGANGSVDAAVGTDEGSIQLVDIAPHDIRFVARLDGHIGAVFTMAFLEVDGVGILASAGRDKDILTWDVDARELLGRWVGHQAQVNHISAVTGTGGRPAVASASDDGTVWIWDVATGASERRWGKRGEWVNAVIELPGRPGQPMLLWGGREGQLRWALPLASTYSAGAGDASSVTMLISFAWAGRPMVAIARSGGLVTLRHAAGFEIGEHRSKPVGTGPGGSDAVIVIPSVMGSELVDSATGRTLWGLSSAAWYTNAWLSGTTLRSLQVTDDERAGRTGRIQATRLLQFPAFMPGFAGIEPYTRLVGELRRACRHPDAVLEFPYDWRLSTAHNARLLATAADEHLQRWRRHPAGNPDARLVLVGHSQGGLLARSYVGALNDPSHVRLTVGIGVPYHGTVKALQLIAGSGMPQPLPRGLMRELARTLPGFYDLLPFYRCVQDEHGMRRLEPADVAVVGGDRELAEAAISFHHRLRDVAGTQTLNIVGIAQPTPQSIRLERGTLILQNFLPVTDENGVLTTTDFGGDGTVPRFSTQPAGEDGLQAMVFAQTSGALCRDINVINAITAQLTAQSGTRWL